VETAFSIGVKTVYNAAQMILPVNRSNGSELAELAQDEK